MPAEALQFLVDSGASSRAHIKKSLIVARCLEAAEALLPQGLFLESTPGAGSGHGGAAGVRDGGEPSGPVAGGGGGHSKLVPRARMVTDRHGSWPRLTPWRRKVLPMFTQSAAIAPLAT